MPDPEQGDLNLENMQKYFDEARAFFKQYPHKSIYKSSDKKIEVIKTYTTLSTPKDKDATTELVAYQNNATPLGEGAFGRVYKGIREGGEVVAVKYSNFTQQSQKDGLEIVLLKGLKEREISALDTQGQFRGHLQVAEKIKAEFELVDFTVMRLEKGQELAKLLDKKNVDKPSTTQKAQLSLKAVYAIYFMHSHQILHRDIKPANFMALLNNDESSVPVIDAGFAATLAKDKDVMIDDVMGSPGYMAPEVETHGIYSNKTDVFALGKTLEKIGFADSDLTQKMTDENAKNRPDTIDVIESLITSVKQLPLDELDVKTIELMDILERIIVTEKKKKNQTYTQETFKAMQIKNRVAEAKNAGFKTDKIEDTLDPDTKAILLKALLLETTDINSPNKQKMIDDIDKVSIKAKFLRETGCLKFGLEFRFFQELFKLANDKTLKTKKYITYKKIPLYMKLKPFNPDTLKGYLLSQRKFPYLGKEQREIASLLKNIKTDKSNTECITSYELEKFINDKNFRKIIKEHEKRPWESEQNENEKLLLIKGFLARESKNNPSDQKLADMKKEFEKIFKKSKISGHTEEEAIKTLETKTQEANLNPSSKSALSDIGQDTKLSTIQKDFMALSQNQSDNTSKPDTRYADLTKVQEKWRKSVHTDLANITPSTSPEDKEVSLPQNRMPNK